MWEKLSDYCLDISKYFLTAVLVTSMVEDFEGMHWRALGLAFLGVGMYLNYRNKAGKMLKRRSQRNKYNKNRRT